MESLTADQAVEAARALVGCLSRFPGIEVAAAACEAIRSLADLVEGKKALSAHGAVPIIAATLRAHSDSQDVALHGLTALHRMSELAATVPALLREGVAALANDALIRHARSPAVCNSAIALLYTFNATESCRVPLLRGGALGRIVAALRTHISDSSFNAAVACYALHGFLHSESDVALAAKTGAWPLVVASLELPAAVGSAAASAQCICALSSMAYTQRDRTHIVAERAGAAIAATVARHAAASSKLAEVACLALADIVESPRNVPVLMREGAAAAVVAAMRAHSGNAQVVDQGCGFLAAAARLGTRETCAQLLREGAADVLGSALHAHGGDADICAAVAAVVIRLAPLDCRLHEVTGAGIVAALRWHEGRSLLALCALQAIFHMASTPEACASLLRCGAGEAVMATVRQYGDDAGSERATSARLALQNLLIEGAISAAQHREAREH